MDGRTAALEDVLKLLVKYGVSHFKGAGFEIEMEYEVEEDQPIAGLENWQPLPAGEPFYSSKPVVDRMADDKDPVLDHPDLFPDGKPEFTKPKAE